MIETSNEKYLTTEDPALNAAWRLYQDFDAASVRQKNIYLILRVSIILLGWTASFLAISTALPLIQNYVSADFARASLIILSVTLTSLITFVPQSNRSLWWIVFRVAAETLRREIYLYRMCAEKYAKSELTPQDKQRKLLSAIKNAQEQVNKLDEIPPYSGKGKGNTPKKQSEQETSAVKINTDHPSDNGFNSMSGSQYIEWRVNPQTTWYAKKIDADYKLMQRSRWSIFFIGILGSVLALLIAPGGEHFAVVTSATIIVFSTYSQLMMFGQIYINYQVTKQSLEDHVSRWNILTPVEQSESERVTKIVTRIENIFQRERILWMQQSTQAQAAAEQTLVKNITEWTHNNFGLSGKSKSEQMANGDDEKDENTLTQ